MIRATSRGYKDPWAHLDPKHRLLVRKFGFDTQNAALQARMYARHVMRDPTRRPELNRAMRLARVSPALYGRQKVVKPKKIFANRRFQALETPPRLGRTARLARILRNRTTGILSSPPSTQSSRAIVSHITVLVGSLDGLMKLSNMSLSRVVTYMARQKVGRAGPAIFKVPIVRGLVREYAILPRVMDTLADLLGRYGAKLTPSAWSAVARSSRSILQGIARGKDVQLGPLVRDILMRIDPAELTRIADRIVGSILRDYVNVPYVSSGPSTTCAICKASDCASQNANRGQNTSNQGQYLAVILRKTLGALNGLLALRNTNVTFAIRKAIDSNLRQFAGMRLLPNVISRHAMAAAAYFAVQFAQYAHGAVDRVLGKMGLSITKDDLAAIAKMHAGDIARFVRRDPSVRIDSVLVDIVVKSHPISLLRGMAGAAVGARTKAFCQLCKTMMC
jgi:hypothetical protein